MLLTLQHDEMGLLEPKKKKKTKAMKVGREVLGRIPGGYDQDIYMYKTVKIKLFVERKLLLINI